MAIDRQLVLDRIERLALAQGLSEGELLARAGIRSGPRTWTRWKREGVEPRLSNLAAIAETYGVPLPDLTGETGVTTIDRLEAKVDLILDHLGIDRTGLEQFAEAFQQLEGSPQTDNGTEKSTPARKRRAASN